ncbi:hypothetical protein DRJ25_01550 [Candidatus Woesearchaeota archaeon]|nr:MAG: hypothetical protein DRJ25_01550 [Candidatus Woesearchaeota archaeon]
MEIDFEGIKKLPPIDRKRSLQKVRELLKREIENSKKQLEETERLLGVAKSEESIIEEIEVPRAKKIDVSKLFKVQGAGEKKGFASLEDQLKNLPEKERKDVAELAKAPIEDVYARIKSFTEMLTQYEQNHGKMPRTYENVSKSELERRREIYELALQEKRRATERGEYKIDEKKEYLMSVAEKMMYKKL